MRCYDHLQTVVDGLSCIDLEWILTLRVEKDIVVDFLQSLFKNQKQYILDAKFLFCTGEVLNASHLQSDQT